MATKVKLISETITPTLAGGTLTGDLNFGDSDKAVFGADSDLQIYHDGTHNYIDDAGTGNLYIRASQSIALQKADGTEDYLTANNNGAVTLYYNNSPKIATSSTGATVTGNLAVTGDLDITGNVNSASVTDLDVTDKTITLGAGQTEALSGGSGIIIDGSSASILWDETNTEFDINNPIHVAGGITFGTSDSTLADNNIMFKSTGAAYIDHNTVGQDINFRISNASALDTTIMTLDAGVGSVGINQPSPSSTYKLDVGGAIRSNTAAPGFHLRETDASNQHWTLGSYGGTFAIRDVTGGTYPVYVETGAPSSTLYLKSSGNVGIGTSNPQTELEISAAQSPFLRLTSEKDGNHDAGDVYGELQFFTQESYGNAPVVSAKIQSLHTRAGTGHSNADAGLAFFTSTATNDATATERMRIESATGNVGIGTTSPDRNLHIETAGDSYLRVSGNRGNANDLHVGNIEFENTFGSAGVIAEMRAITGNSGTQSTKGQLAFYTDDGSTYAERLRIDSSGNVGIGTSNPDANLHVEKLLNATWANLSEAATYPAVKIGNYRADTDSNLFIGCVAGGRTGLQGANDAGTSAFDIALNPFGGNVGIGTSNPDGLLHISSRASGDAIVIIEADTDNDNEGDNPAVWFKGDGDINKGAIRVADNQLQLISNVSVESGIKFYVGSTDNTSTTDPGTSATQRMFINSSGRVHIGHNVENTYNSLGTLTVKQAAADTGIGIIDSGENNTLKLVNDNSVAKIYHNASATVIQIGDGNKAVTMPSQPAFHAYGPGGSISDGSVVVYANTYVNTGSHYSTSNGRFTAPVAGVYLFFWSAIGNNTNDVYRWFLHKNGSATGIGGNDVHLRQDTSATGSEYATNGSRVQMVSLSANDYVYIYFDSDSGTAGYYQSDYVNFGGYLIG